jgi:hypothetical protein
VGVTADALAGSSVDDLATASSAAGVRGSLIGDWIAPSCVGGREAAGAAGVALDSCAPEVVPDGTGDADDDDGLPGVAALSGFISLMTVRQAPSTRTNEHALIIR